MREAMAKAHAQPGLPGINYDANVMLADFAVEDWKGGAAMGLKIDALLQQIGDMSDRLLIPTFPTLWTDWRQTMRKVRDDHAAITKRLPT